MKEIKFEDIKPIGNFDFLLKKLRTKVDSIILKCNENKSYNKSIADCIKLIVGELGIIDVLGDGIKKEEGWNIEEMKICLLYTHLLIIDLNDVAQLYLNNITMASKLSQLQDCINHNKEIFGNLIIKQ